VTTFGETSVLTTAHGLGSNVIYLFGPYSPASDGTLTDLAWYNKGGGAGTDPAKIFCYLDSAGAPGALKAVTAEFNTDGGSAGWEIHAVVTPVAILASAAYWIGAGTSAGSSDVFEATESSGGNLAYKSGAYASPPDPFGTPTGTLSWRGSTYGIYTAGSLPTADFTGTPLSGSSPLSVAFTDTSTGEGGSPTFLWQKNDGSGWVNFAGTPTAQNPTETFT
jgi:PKD repeat protein